MRVRGPPPQPIPRTTIGQGELMDRREFLGAGAALTATAASGSAAPLPRRPYRNGIDLSIIAHVARFDTIEDVTDADQTVRSGLKPEHLPVFDCAFNPYRGQRSIAALAHLKMMGAAQPFISGAISKTVNMPTDSTVEDIRDAYVQAWKMGLKCVAIYRDGSKRSQPLNTKR